MKTKMEQAFLKWWMGCYPEKSTDLAVTKFLGLNQHSVWLKSARNALFLSARTMAARLGVSHAQYLKFEKAEFDKSISLKNLERCAHAMDCELVYAIRLKSGRPFSEYIWTVLLEGQTEPQQGMGFKMRRPKFRRKHNWKRNGL